MERDQEVDNQGLDEGKEVCGSGMLGPRGACDAAKEPATPAKGSPKNDTPRIRSSSSSSSKSKCDDSDKIVESDASTEPSSSRRPVETTPSAGGSKNLDTATKDAAATVRRVLSVVVCVRA